jgi:hypothetical protein
MGSFEEMAASAFETLGAGREASDPYYVVVRNRDELERMCDDIAEERDVPIVGLALRSYSSEPVLRASDIRSVVGAGARIYLVTSDELLDGLREMLGSRLHLWPGAVRVWWPGASAAAEPGDHPVVLGLEDEDYRVTLNEFAEEFELSRPRVRARIRMIEDSRAYLERELTSARKQNHQVQERLRDAQIDCHELRTRAERAEASLERARHTRPES